AQYGGLKRVVPHLVAVFLIVTLSSIGLPGLNGFVGEFLILLGAYRWSPAAAAFAATGVILSATYMLWMFQRVNYGPVTHEKNRGLRDLSVREWIVLAPICVMAILMGVLPGIFLKPMEPAVRRAVQQIVGTPGPVNASVPGTVPQVTVPPAPAPGGPEAAAGQTLTPR